MKKDFGLKKVLRFEKDLRSKSNLLVKKNSGLKNSLIKKILGWEKFWGFLIRGCLNCSSSIRIRSVQEWAPGRFFRFFSEYYNKQEKKVHLEKSSKKNSKNSGSGRVFDPARKPGFENFTGRAPRFQIFCLGSRPASGFHFKIFRVPGPGIRPAPNPGSDCWISTRFRTLNCGPFQPGTHSSQKSPAKLPTHRHPTPSW